MWWATSVAKILRSNDLLASCARVRNSIASEYASSPVAQPGTHMRIAEFASRSRTSGAITLSSRIFHAWGSRKKPLTLIVRSLARAVVSCGSARSRSR